MKVWECGREYVLQPHVSESEKNISTRIRYSGAGAEAYQQERTGIYLPG